MALSDGKPSFLNKLARFVSNPTTDWTSLEARSGPAAPAGAGAPSQEDSAHLRRERRRHARRIRQREFRLLRRIRSGEYDGSADGLKTSLLEKSSGTRVAASSSAEQHASGIFDVNQINTIEKQMADQWWAGQPEFTPEDTIAKTQLLIETQIHDFGHGAPGQDEFIAFDEAMLPAVAPEPAPVVPAHQPPPVGAHEAAHEAAHTFISGEAHSNQIDTLHDVHDVHGVGSALGSDEVATTVSLDRSVPEGLPAFVSDSDAAATVQLADLPDSLNEPAILFAQHRDEDVERQLMHLVDAAEQASAADAAELLLALLDFYRATAQEAQFEATAIELVQRYGRSAPQYVLGSAPAHTTMGATRFDTLLPAGATHWVAPARLDMTALLMLRPQLARKSAHVLIDWRPVQSIDDSVWQPLVDVLRLLAEQKKELIMWGGQHLLQLCAGQQGQAEGPSAPRHLVWLARLELVRIMYRQEDFDALALEYCLELEESPPSWQRPACRFVDGDASAELDQPPPGAVHAEATGAADAASLRRSLRHPLQWQGELQAPLQALLASVDAAAVQGSCTIDCGALERMDYGACADLLAWLLARTPGQPAVRFVQVNRLLGVFWRIMGISGHADVQLRTN